MKILDIQGKAPVKAYRQIRNWLRGNPNRFSIHIRTSSGDVRPCIRHLWSGPHMTTNHEACLSRWQGKGGLR